MLRPRSLLRPLRRRPSAAMLVASTALFLSLGGVGYAATTLANNSVGTAQIKNSAVTYNKITPGAVGSVRVDQAQIQRRVTTICSPGTQAMTAVAINGKATCSPTLTPEYDSGTGTSVALTTASTNYTVASYAVPGGPSYFVQATPYVTVTPESSGTNAEQITVSCTLAAGPATTAIQTRSVTLNATQGGSKVYASVPLTVTAPSSANSITADVTCTQTATGGTPTVAAQSTIYTLETSSNTSATTAG